MINNINYNKKLSTFLIISSLLLSVSSFADTDSNGNTVHDGSHSTASGYQNTVNGTGSTASGYQNTVNESYSTALGYKNGVTGNHSTAVGSENEVNGGLSTALGFENKVTGNFSEALGYRNKVTGEYLTVLGKWNKVTGSDSTAIGHNNNVIGDNNFAFGNNITFENGATGSVALGNDSKVTESNVVSVGSQGKERRITNVAEGINDTDAVNYGQLKKMMQNNGNVDEKIKTLDSNLSGAVAQAMAMANIPQVGDNKLFSIGVGGAYYNKQGGFAVGISGTESSNIFIYKISAGVDTKKRWSIGAGFNINFGNNKKANINNECCDLSNEKVKRLENENKNMKEQINDLKNLVKQLMNKIDQKPQIVEVPKVIEKKILVACFSTENKCIIHGFAVAGKVPSKEEQRQLKEVANKINTFAHSGTMSIVGHTDSDGSDAYNDKLSLQRATTVSRLLKEAGLSEALTVKEITGKGEREPIAPNTTKGGKYLNRRVELLFDDVVIK